MTMDAIAERLDCSRSAVRLKLFHLDAVDIRQTWDHYDWPGTQTLAKWADAVTTRDIAEIVGCSYERARQQLQDQGLEARLHTDTSDRERAAALLRIAATLENVAGAIRQARTLMGWTQADLAEHLGVAVQDDEHARASRTVHAWETGKSPPSRSSREKMRRLAGELNTKA
jgi:ribosome-binding protein aMBF1 (putative translation factor)